jgi:serine/threonine protein kinase
VYTDSPYRDTNETNLLQHQSIQALNGKDEVLPTTDFPLVPSKFEYLPFLEAKKMTVESVVHSPLCLYQLERFLKDKDGAESVAILLDQIYQFKDGLPTIEKGKTLITDCSEGLKKLGDSLASDLQSFFDGDVDESAYDAMRAAFKGAEDSSLEFLQNHWDGFIASKEYERLGELLYLSEQPVQMKDFTMFRDLGRGAFGAVAGGQVNYTGQMFAIKCMNRKQIKGKKALKLTKMERAVLKEIGEKPTHFAIALRYSFIDEEYMYFVLKLLSGGDLQFHLGLDKKFSEERAKFYTAEIALGLTHLHSLGIVYRDMKPENVLLDDDGHCCISDMGLATKFKKGKKTMKGRAGTPGYWPPEMVNKEPYNNGCDWWSLGAMTYEMLVGDCPFATKVTKLKDRNAGTLEYEPQYPEELVSEDAKSFIQGCLNRDMTQRLGATEKGFQEIMDHPWFKGYDWEKMKAKEATPPFKPNAGSINATAISDLDEKNAEHEYRKLKLTEEDKCNDFDYVASYFHEKDMTLVLKMKDEGLLQDLHPAVTASAGGGCCTVQ